MPRESSVRIVRQLATRGYTADREAVTLLAGASDPEAVLDRAVERAPDDGVVIAVDHVRSVLAETDGDNTTISSRSDIDSNISPATESHSSPPEMEGSISPAPEGSSSGDSGHRGQTGASSTLQVSDDVVSTGTGTFEDFVSVFRDRYETLAKQLRSRVTHRPTNAVANLSDGSDASLIGMVADVGTTKNGHTRIELEDTNGTFPCLVLKDRDVAAAAREVVTDEIIAVEGTVANRSGDDGILFVDALYFPDVPRTHSPTKADRPVEAALISDVHVGSQEFLTDAWGRFTDWLHSEAAESVEYLLIAGDMVEGVGVYPGQDEELDIVDIYDQYEAFNEHLKAVPGDLEIVLIPGNHDAVRLAEPQPAFDETLRSIMSAHDVRIAPNPATVTIEGVSVLMYHGVSLDEIIAELPEDLASYERPADAMAQLLKKRHLAPKYGEKTRIAPEAEDHLVIDDVPDIFHTGHIHKLGYGRYHNVLTINSSCWQAQTAFQKSVNLVPDVAYAPIVSLDTLELTVRHFA